MVFSGRLNQTTRYRQTAGDNDARDMLSAQLETTGALLGLIEALQIARFGIP